MILVRFFVLSPIHDDNNDTLDFLRWTFSLYQTFWAKFEYWYTMSEVHTSLRRHLVELQDNISHVSKQGGWNIVLFKHQDWETFQYMIAIFLAHLCFYFQCHTYANGGFIFWIYIVWDTSSGMSRFIGIEKTSIKHIQQIHKALFSGSRRRPLFFIFWMKCLCWNKNFSAIASTKRKNSSKNSFQLFNRKPRIQPSTHLNHSSTSTSARRVAFKGADDTWEEASDGEKAPEETSERCRLKRMGSQI